MVQFYGKNTTVISSAGSFCFLLVNTTCIVHHVDSLSISFPPSSSSSSGPRVTIINPMQAGRIFQISYPSISVAPYITLSGFTLTNVSKTASGGCAYVFNARLVFDNMIVENNSKLISDTNVKAVGIFLDGANCNVLVTNSYFGGPLSFSSMSFSYRS
jgi:hypothetical protein